MDNSPGGAYGLAQPQLADVRASLTKVFGERVDPIWVRLLSTAGLTGTETDLDSLTRLGQAMLASDQPVVALCGRGLVIRLASFAHLRSVHDSVIGVDQ